MEDVFLTSKEKKYMNVPLYFWLKEGFEEGNVSFEGNGPHKVDLKEIDVIMSGEIKSGLEEVNEEVYSDDVGQAVFDKEDRSYKFVRLFKNGLKILKLDKKEMLNNNYYG